MVRIDYDIIKLKNKIPNTNPKIVVENKTLKKPNRER